MHFEILVEGQCELTFLSIIMPKIVGEYKCPNTWKIHKHRGIGSIPADPAAPPKVTDSSLLGQLPAKLRAYSAKPDPNREGANKQVISSQADSLIKISRIWADFFPANTSN